jgi:hypothetical protein
LVVYGFGEKKTPNAFIVACDQFIFVENLTPKPEEVTTPEVEVKPSKGK